RDGEKTGRPADAARTAADGGRPGAEGDAALPTAAARRGAALRPAGAADLDLQPVPVADAGQRRRPAAPGQPSDAARPDDAAAAAAAVAAGRAAAEPAVRRPRPGAADGAA